MFRLYITLAYIIPVIYLFFRIKDLFISKRYKRWYILVYLMIAAIYPLSGRFGHQNMNLLIQMFSAISDYILPFYLYLFLTTLLFDLFLLFNLMIRIVPNEIRKKKSIRIYTFSVMILLSLAVVAAGAINLNTIRISKYRIEIPRKQAISDHVRIVFVADFHIKQNTSIRFVKQFVNKVNALHPDLLLYGGDIVEGDRENETTKTVEDILRNITAKYGIYGVVGNHEFYGGQQQGSFFRRAGIALLCDTVVRIDSAFYLAGRYDQHFERRKSAGEILENVKADLPIIMMDHRPTQLQEVSQTAADLQFSGHTHNGQLFPLNYIIHSMYELSWGYRKIRNTHFFVTSGLRLWGPPVKTAGISEIMLVDINLK